MIVTRTPYRISFFGGGTDYPAWFQENGGSVLTSSINKYCYLTCRVLPPFFNHRHKVVWSKVEEVNEFGEIQHPAVREVLKYLNLEFGLDIHHNGDLPARTGLGSSSAFTVGLLNSLLSLQGRLISKTELAKLAIYVERVLLKEEVGVQDQIETAFGGLNRVHINPDGGFSVNPLVLSQERISELQSHMLLFYTGVVRHASKVAESKVESIKSKKVDLQEMQNMVDEASNILHSNQSLELFGKLLHESWKIKKSLSDKVSTGFIDEMYDAAIKAGAYGGKVLGAGGGGFMLFLVKPELKSEVMRALADYLYIPIKFEFSGSQIVFYENQEYTQKALLKRDFKKFDFENYLKKVA